eukprot:TRINITY_DN4730_c0_g1_i7.p4 TRINITY_DN4730_c0_g1~~TRINITY_DN4730_c0_g1_i7.p4  ORF type:complete len:121 (+),score=4.21 TRINITY_DN4730_c0_g1_i7:624-986(+)
MRTTQSRQHESVPCEDSTKSLDRHLPADSAPTQCDRKVARDVSTPGEYSPLALYNPTLNPRVLSWAVMAGPQRFVLPVQTGVVCPADPLIASEIICCSGAVITLTAHISWCGQKQEEWEE